jgi:hypothetical protein
MNLTLTEQNGQHFYNDGNGVSLPSVTAILHVLNTYAGIRKAVLEDASDIGSQAADIIRRLIEGDYIHEWYYLDKRIRNAVSAYDRFRKQALYKPRRAETIVANLDDGYAGTEDSDGDIPAGHIVTEWKTGDILPAHYFQVAAYYMAHIKTFPRERLHGACIVQLDKETGRPHPYFISLPEVEGYYQGFLALKLVSTQIKDIKGKEETWKLQ